MNENTARTINSAAHDAGVVQDRNPRQAYDVVAGNNAESPTKGFLQNKCYVRTRFGDENGARIRQFATAFGDWTTDIRQAEMHAARQVCANKKNDGVVMEVGMRVIEGEVPAKDVRTMVFPVAIAYAKNCHNQVPEGTEGRLVTNSRAGYGDGEAIRDVPTRFAQDAFFYASKEHLVRRIARGDAGMQTPINDPARRIHGYDIRPAYCEFVLNPKG